MMKRTLALLLALLCALSLAACAGLPFSGAPEAEPVPAETARPAEAEETPDAPEETPAPEETSPGPEISPAPENVEEAREDETVVPLPLSSLQQYEANVFLSNFAEQAGFDRFDAAEASDAQLFAFAHLWAKINRRSAIAYQDSYETMTLDAVNDILGRYMALAIAPADGTDYSAAFGMGNYDWDHCWYEGGLFYFPAADGESYTYFAVVDEASTVDGRFNRFRFTVYQLNLDIYWDNNGIPAEYYHLTPAEAAERAASGEITPLCTGTADGGAIVLADSGRESWYLIRYTLDKAA